MKKSMVLIIFIAFAFTLSSCQSAAVKDKDTTLEEPSSSSIATQTEAINKEETSNEAETVSKDETSDQDDIPELIIRSHISLDIFWIYNNELALWYKCMIYITYDEGAVAKPITHAIYNIL